MKLIVTNTNWADEMDIFGFEVIASDEIYKLQIEAIDLLFQYKESVEIFVGSNEEITFKKDYMRNFLVTSITEKDSEHLLKLFGSLCEGHCLFDRLVELALDILEEYDLEKSRELSSKIYG